MHSFGHTPRPSASRYSPDLPRVSSVWGRWGFGLHRRGI
nr:MAG TPA: hypothetical protein [Caudoviricetes sp.]